MRRFALPLFTAVAISLFVLAVAYYGPIQERSPVQRGDRVVITPAVQVMMMAGDRYLAANLENIRLAATGRDIDPQTGKADGRYLLRAHRTVAKLNPCHEDNYYLANAVLAWGGATQEANDVLSRATECRRWDHIPPFLYGFNQYFFDRNYREAKRAFEISAQRSPDHASSLRRLAIMVVAEDMDDNSMALNYLRQQRDTAKDSKLREMLDKRVGRLEGLIALRRAQAEFEKRFSRPLKDPNELVESGVLDGFPTDPLGLGYEFENGVIRMRRLKIRGVER